MTDLIHVVSGVLFYAAFFILSAVLAFGFRLARPGDLLKGWSAHVAPAMLPTLPPFLKPVFQVCFSASPDTCAYIQDHLALLIEGVENLDHSVDGEAAKIGVADA